MSILWSSFALTCLVFGIGRRERSLRYVALALFAVVGWKVFFYDLRHLERIYRILAFFVLGVLVLTGSLLYFRQRQAFTTRDRADEPDDATPDDATKEDQS